MKKAIDFLVFSNLYIAFISFWTCKTTFKLFDLTVNEDLIYFVGSSTLCSYSLHWALTFGENGDSDRLKWTAENRHILYILALVSSLFVGYFAWQLIEFWAILLPLGLLTFIYTAPKIPFAPFTYLRGKVIAKTLYLAIVWTVVVAVLPILVSKALWTPAMLLFTLNRFIFLFLICALFDYRDKSSDATDGVQTVHAVLSGKRFDNTFYLCMAFELTSLGGLFYDGFSLIQLLPFLFTAFLLLLFFEKLKKTTSDYWFYIFLDGLMIGF